MLDAGTQTMQGGEDAGWEGGEGGGEPRLLAPLHPSYSARGPAASSWRGPPEGPNGMQGPLPPSAAGVAASVSLSSSFGSKSEQGVLSM